MTLQEFTAWLDGYLTGCPTPDKAAIMAKLREVEAKPFDWGVGPARSAPDTGRWPAAPSVRPKWPGVPWLEPVVSLGSPAVISTFNGDLILRADAIAPLPDDIAKAMHDDTLYQN
jgi:hypothetical protein